MYSINPNGSRINLNSTDSVRDLRRLVDDPRVKVVQFAEPLPSKLLDALNDDFFISRPDVELRAFGFYSAICDLSFCSRMSNVERFRADCLRSAIGVHHISRMSRLKLLGIGIWELDSFEVLNDVTPDIADLSLGRTKSRKPDLTLLSRFRSLKSLFLENQQKNIDVLSGHERLEKLSIRGLTLKTVELFRTFPKLWSLEVRLGGTRNLAALQGMTTLKYLEIWRVSKMYEIDMVSTLTGLQHLFIENLPHISQLPQLDRLVNLRKVTLGDMKGLADVSALTDAPALEELVHWTAKTLPEDYFRILRNGRMKFANVKFGNVAKNDQFKQLCLELGISNSVNYSFSIR